MPTSRDYTRPATASVQLIAIRCVEYVTESLKDYKMGKSVYVQDV
jgi:hypothetical protein